MTEDVCDFCKGVTSPSYVCVYCNGTGEWNQAAQAYVKNQPHLFVYRFTAVRDWIGTDVLMQNALINYSCLRLKDFIGLEECVK